MKLNAYTRLTAAKADEKQGVVFLESLGFTGVQVKLSGEDRISFKYKTCDKAYLNKHFGAERKNGTTGVGWKFGVDGWIILKENSNVVVLQNSKRNSKQLKPIETHVPDGTPQGPKVKIPPKPPINKPAPPVPTPKVPHVDFDDPDDGPLPPKDNPNNPGSKENDDKNVPVTFLPPDLAKQYNWAQGMTEASYRLKFNAKLWHYLNTSKFGGRMQAPRFNLLKNVAANKFRLRGRWWPSRRVLDIAPRLYNAHQNFFVEIFLHEMCHQAVSEIDRVSDRTAQGHGYNWQTWMRKVGLNPRRFDPNDNSTYMDKDEKKIHDQKIEKTKEALEDIKDKGLRHLHPYNVNGPTLATVLWRGEVMNGIIVGPTVQTRTKFLFLDIKNLYASRAAVVVPDNMYEFAGDDAMREKLKSSGAQERVQYWQRSLNIRSERRSGPRRRRMSW